MEAVRRASGKINASRLDPHAPGDVGRAFKFMSLFSSTLFQLGRGRFVGLFVALLLTAAFVIYTISSQTSLFVPAPSFKRFRLDGEDGSCPAKSGHPSTLNPDLVSGLHSAEMYKDLSCSPQAYSNGSWQYRPRVEGKSMQKEEDTLQFAGFQGCASSREFWWHLAADKKEQWSRFPNASSWGWTAGEECRGLRGWDAENVVQDLVEDGGWLLIGDSVTENHFFSLSCLLYPHIIATPDYTKTGGFDRAWPQHLHLNPSSPLVSRLSFPAGFEIATTPLVSFRRIDILFSKEELIAIHDSVHPSFPAEKSLFSGEGVWTAPVKEYLNLFTDPLPHANYATMVVSTGGHWSTTLFSGYRNILKKGSGIEGVIAFFEEAMKRWTVEVQSHLWHHERRQRVPATGSPKYTNKKKRVVVRAYLPGHQDCHKIRKPWDEVQPFKKEIYNWGYIWEFNDILERLISEPARFPGIYYLPIDRPGRLRPDAHSTGDCLHIMTGAGVMEGWTHYIWHFITRELPYLN